MAGRAARWGSHGGERLLTMPSAMPKKTKIRPHAKSWGSRLVNIGKAAHINAAGGLGEWNEGHRLLESLRTQIE